MIIEKHDLFYRLLRVIVLWVMCCVVAPDAFADDRYDWDILRSGGGIRNLSVKTFRLHLIVHQQIFVNIRQ